MKRERVKGGKEKLYALKPKRWATEVKKKRRIVRTFNKKNSKTYLRNFGMRSSQLYESDPHQLAGNFPQQQFKKFNELTYF